MADPLPITAFRPDVFLRARFPGEMGRTEAMQYAPVMRDVQRRGMPTTYAVTFTDPVTNQVYRSTFNTQAAAQTAFRNMYSGYERAIQERMLSTARARDPELGIRENGPPYDHTDKLQVMSRYTDAMGALLRSRDVPDFVRQGFNQLLITEGFAMPPNNGASHTDTQGGITGLFQHSDSTFQQYLPQTVALLRDMTRNLPPGHPYHNFNFTEQNVTQYRNNVLVQVAATFARNEQNMQRIAAAGHALSREEQAALYTIGHNIPRVADRILSERLAGRLPDLGAPEYARDFANMRSNPLHYNVRIGAGERPATKMWPEVVQDMAADTQRGWDAYHRDVARRLTLGTDQGATGAPTRRPAQTPAR